MEAEELCEDEVNLMCSKEMVEFEKEFSKEETSNEKNMNNNDITPIQDLSTPEKKEDEMEVVKVKRLKREYWSLENHPFNFDLDSYWKEIKTENHQRTGILYSSLFSHDERYFLTCSSTGLAALWDITKLDSQKLFKESLLPGAIYQSKLSSDSQKLYVCGKAAPLIKVYEWESLLQGTAKSISIDFSSKLPSKNKVKAVHEICFGPHNQSGLYFGCDTGDVHHFDLEKEVISRSFSHHSEAILSVKSQSVNQLVTCAEDNSIAVWDLRANRVAQTLHPYASYPGNKPKNVLSCMEVHPSGNWLACGGTGSLMSVYYLPSASMTTSIPIAGNLSSLLWDDQGQQFLGLSSSAVIYRTEISGKYKHSFNSSIPYAYDFALAEKQRNLAIVGLGSKIDVIKMTSYQNYALDFF